MKDKLNSFIEHLWDFLILHLWQRPFRVLSYRAAIYNKSRSIWNLKYPSNRTKIADVVLADPFYKINRALPRGYAISRKVQKHENKHHQQNEEYGTPKYCWLSWWYIIKGLPANIKKYGILEGIIKAYENSPFEVDARNAEKQ